MGQKIVVNWNLEAFIFWFNFASYCLDHFLIRQNAILELHTFNWKLLNDVQKKGVEYHAKPIDFRWAI